MSNPNQPATKIILNMEEIEVHQDRVNYQQLARLAYPQDPENSPDIVYTITVSDPDIGEQSIARGDKPIEIKEGMVFNVRKTGRS